MVLWGGEGPKYSPEGRRVKAGLTVGRGRFKNNRKKFRE